MDICTRMYPFYHQKSSQRISQRQDNHPDNELPNDLARTNSTSEPVSSLPSQPSSTNIADDLANLPVEINFGGVDFPKPIMAICTDFSRTGSAIYSESVLKLVADRKDPSDPYKGLDIIIQRINPGVVIVSSVHKRLVNFLEKTFKFKTIDLSKLLQTRDRNTAKRPRLQPPTCNNGQINQATQRFRTWNTSINQVNQNSGDVGEHLIENSSDIAALMREVEEDDEVFNHAFTLVIVPNRWFCMSQGIQKLTESELVRSNGCTKPEEKMFFVTSRVKQSIDVCAIRAIGAIDKYLLYEATKDPFAGTQIIPTQSAQHLRSQQLQARSQQSTASNQLVPQSAMPVLDFKYLDPGPVLSIDRFTLQTLNIFPVTNKKSHEQTEEGSQSLFEILNQCQSPQGKKQLRTMMLWPLQEMNDLQDRLDIVEFFVRHDNRLMRDQLCIQLKNIVPLTSLIVKMNQTVGTYRDLSVLYKCLWSFMSIIDLLKSIQSERPSLFDRIIALDSVEMRATVESMINIVDFEASKREGRVQVCVGVDELVDAKKDIVKNLTRFCDEVATEETSRYKDLVGKTFSTFYIPRIGFLDSIDYTSTSEIAKIRSCREFDVLLVTEKCIYFKSKRMEDLDNNAGDIACDLIDVQEKVISELQNELLKHSEAILGLMELCGELDCMVSFSLIATQYGYTRPHFNAPDESGFDIHGVYHPLYCTKTNMVANEVKFYNAAAERQVKCMLITGPNSCGKTTYMKTVCIVTYMAHLGCFVPAESARLPVIDAILTRMQSANSITMGLSTFATDLHQVQYALSRATERSIIAIDEFGKGTLAVDGFHLLKGLTMYFASRGLRSPYVMIATHFNRIINHLQSYEEYIIYRTFKVKRDPRSEEIMYEFKLVNGVSESSLADRVASKAGVPQSIIHRASQIRDHLIQGRQINPRPPCGA